MGAIYQISVFLENRTGSLSKVTRVLADSGINLRALSIAESADYGVLRLIANDTDKATNILLEKGFVLSKTPVFVVAVPDEPAGLAKILDFLAEKNIDIEYMYSLFTHQDGNAYIVFRLADEEGFRNVVEAHGLSLVTASELGLK